MKIENVIAKELITSRFILAFVLTIGYLFGVVDSQTIGYILAFYFGSNIVSQIQK